MKNYFCIAFFISMVTICHAQKQVVLDLANGVTWRDVFDTGFRPTHLSRGQYMCTEHDVAVTIQNSKTGLEIDLGVGNVDFKLKENHQLIQILFYGSEKRSLDEARAKSEIFAKMLGEGMTQRATLETFQNKHEVDYSGRKIDPPAIEEHVDLETSTNAAKINDFAIIYSFNDSYQDHKPLLEHLSVTLQSKEAKRAKRLTEKIRPPEGYEHISLEPNQEKEEAEKRISKGELKQERDDVRTSQSRKRQEIESEEAVEEKPSKFPWIIAGVLLLGILLLLFKTFKGKSTS